MAKQSFTVKKPEHLLVDLDGTLVDYSDLPVHFEFIIHGVGALKKYGGWIKAIRALRATNSVLKKTSKTLTNDKRAMEVFSNKLGVDIKEGEKIYTECLSGLFPSLKKHFHPVPGAHEFLMWAKDHFPLTLATNPVWPVDIIKLRLEWAGVDSSIFKNITDNSKMHACKPHAEYYEEVLKMLGLKANQAFLIGNELDMDLPAVKQGIPVYIVKKANKVVPLDIGKEQKASAWTGSFSGLKKLLESM